MGKYVRKPVEVEAIKWDGINIDECEQFVGESLDVAGSYIAIETSIGRRYVQKNNWIIKNEEGEFYPCEQDEFQQSYEKIEKVTQSLKYKIGQEFLLNQTVHFETSTASISASKNSEVTIIDIDKNDGEAPYKVFFEEADKWIFLSEYELDSITFSALSDY